MRPPSQAPLGSRSGPASCRSVEERRKLLARIQKLLGGLRRPVRQAVLAERLSQPQRLALEQWMLGQCSAAPAYKASAEPRVLSSRKAPEARPIGLVVHRRRDTGECYYSVVITVGRLRLLTREVRDIKEALRFHAALDDMKKQLGDYAKDLATFEARFKEALSYSLQKHELKPAPMGLRFCVCLAPLWLPKPLITPPFRAEGPDMEAGLHAWRQLGEARGSVPRRGSVLEVLSPEEIAASWARIRTAYLEILASKTTSLEASSIAARLEALEAVQQVRQDSQLQRWNQRQMAREETMQRQCAERHKAQDGTKSGRMGKGELGTSLKTSRSLRAIDTLLLRWERQDRSTSEVRRISASKRRRHSLRDFEEEKEL